MCSPLLNDKTKLIFDATHRDDMIFIRYVGRSHSPSEQKVSQWFQIMGSDTGQRAITLQCFKLFESVLPFPGATIDRGNAY